MTAQIAPFPAPSAMLAGDRFTYSELAPSKPGPGARIGNAVMGTVAILFGLVHYATKADFLIRHLLTGG